MDIQAFRDAFPEFSDETVYTDDSICFWWGLAEMQVSCRWGKMRCRGIMLYVAHEIVIASQNSKAVINGGSPGVGGGLVSSKTVGSVSVAYDRTGTNEVGAGFWNGTIYGQQYYRLSRMFGQGAIQL